jgi:YegS/Rv2252/BmrU family lipid kinase
MKKMLFVFNPNSGKGLIKNYLLDIVKVFTEGGYELCVYPTKSPRDGYEYVKENGSRFDVVACSGGDGTLNEVVDAALAIQPDDRPPIGYIPSGSTNDFAVSLGISKNMVDAAADIVKGEPCYCDVGDFNGRTFNYVAAFGAFTNVSYATPQEMKNILGHQAYYIEAVKRITEIRPSHMRIYANDRMEEGDFIYGMVSNAKSVAGMTNLLGDNVKLNDGLFELMFIRNPRTPLDFQQLVDGFINQRIQDKDQAVCFQCSDVVVECDEGVDWVLDGEYGGNNTRVEISVLGSQVRLISTDIIE